MRLTWKFAIGSVAMIPGLLALGLPAGAAAPSVTSGVGVSSSQPAVTVLPSSRIVTNSTTGINHYQPKTLSAAGKKGTACSRATAGAIIRNRTTATQQVTYKGAAFGSPIPAGAGEFICYLSATGTPPPTTAVFGLTGSKSHLTISFT